LSIRERSLNYGENINKIPSPLAPKKSPELEDWFPRTFDINKLNYRLSSTPQWDEYLRRKEKGEEEEGTRLSISQFGEYAIPLCLKMIGYDNIEPPGFPHPEKTYIASIVGSGLHEASVLFASILEGGTLEEIEATFPITKPEKNIPYLKALEGISLSLNDNATEEEKLEVLERVWKEFHKDPGLIDRFPGDMEPLFKNLGLKSVKVEEEVRYDEGPNSLVYEPGRRLAAHFAKNFATSKFRRFKEATTVANLKCKLQITCRTDSILTLEDENGEITFLVEDLKTGNKRKIDNPVLAEIDSWQSQLMILVSERFGTHFLKSGYLDRMPVYILYGINHHSKVGKDSTRLIYNWFNKGTGEVVEDERQINDRKALNEIIDWVGLAVNVFKPYVKHYFKTGEVKEHAGSRRAPKKQPNKPNPFGFVQGNLKLREARSEFDKIVKEMDLKVEPKNRTQEIFKIGVVGIGKDCSSCGNEIVRDCKLDWGKEKTSRITYEERCSRCGKPGHQEKYKLVLNSRIEE